MPALRNFNRIICQIIISVYTNNLLIFHLLFKLINTMHLKINDFTFEAENKYLSSPISHFVLLNVSNIPKLLIIDYFRLNWCILDFDYHILVLLWPFVRIANHGFHSFCIPITLIHNDKHFHYFEINYSNGFPKTSQTEK